MYYLERSHEKFDCLDEAIEKAKATDQNVCEGANVVFRVPAEEDVQIDGQLLMAVTVLTFELDRLKGIAETRGVITADEFAKLDKGLRRLIPLIIEGA